MSDTCPPSKSLIARLGAAWRRWRMDAARRRALEDIVARPHEHWLEDAGITRDEAHRLLDRQRLDRIAEWMRLRGGGL